MKRLMLVAVMVLLMAGVAVAQDITSVSSQHPFVTDTRLVSFGGSTLIYVHVWTPYEEGLYRIKTAVFNLKGERIRVEDSGWFLWKFGDHIAYSCDTKLLRGDGYYVKATVDYAQFIGNERQ